MAERYIPVFQMQNSHYTFFKIKFINEKITKIDFVPKLNIGVIMGYKGFLVLCAYLYESYLSLNFQSRFQRPKLDDAYC